MPFLMGIDGGGTGCRARLLDMSGRTLGDGTSGAANIMTNFAGAKTNILEAARAAAADAGLAAGILADTSAFLGLAGANIGDDAVRLTEQLPFRACRIDTDATIALQGAVGSGDGLVAIIGTGSIFVYRLGGVVRTAGGWGFMVGDLSSGARLGRVLLQETLLAYDGIQEGSDLTESVLAEFEQSPQTLVEYAHTALPGEFGTFAPRIFEFADRGDRIGRDLIRGAVAQLEQTLNAITSGNDLKICLLGGLGKIYRDLLSEPLRARLREPLADAVSGAAALALENFGQGTSSHG